ncbi:MAG TPA: GNAT family N-acetyltransferase [Rhodobacteraceae bacterium]|nr:GNAT family N-acetyltransferase [Paracoccaceae bacterium]
MSLTIAIDDPRSEDGRMLVDQSEVEMREVFPPEEIFTYSPEQLWTPQTSFYIARLDGRALGCVALLVEGRIGEIKRLFVHSDARGNLIGRKLMKQLETDARRMGITLLHLETGHKLKAAVRLYKSLGYTPCAAYGDYPDIPSNLFLEKRL